MTDIFVMLGIIVIGCGGFVALYAIYMFLLAKISGNSFWDEFKWWDD